MLVKTYIFLAISSIALLFSIYTFSISHRRRRKKLLNAVYHHVKVYQEWHKNFVGKHDVFRNKIKEDKSYMPYPVLSSVNDLSYEHIIEAMEWLKSEKIDGGKSEEELLSRYFHSHAFLCAHVESFEKDLVMTWPTERKLAIWEGFGDVQEKTSDYAEKLMPILEGAIDEQKKGRIGRFCSEIIKKIGRL